MMNITGKKPDVSLILERINKPAHSADGIKEANIEQAVEAPTNEAGDEINSDTAQEAAASALTNALNSKDSKAIATAIKELFELFSLGKE